MAAGVFWIIAGIGVLALAAAPLTRVLGRAAAYVFALAALGCVGALLSVAPAIFDGQVVRASVPWAPNLGLTLSFSLDGLSLLFALLITGIGAFVLLYAGDYLHGHHHLGRLYAFLLGFMGSMVGLVTADNLLLLFIFWELTSILSYLLIGFDHTKQQSRDSALMALLVTGGGGLVLLAGILVLGITTGTYELPELFSQADAIRASAAYPAIVILIVIGAATKSAQVPFHFWLPEAMAAPTPISAYLHSATMVKAGVYLLARLSGTLGQTIEWHYIVTSVGAVTMLTAAILAMGQTDLKRILAYTTVSALGMLVLLIGLDTVSAMKAAVVFIIVHALYKAGLFLVTGIVDHETGTRNIQLLRGLAFKMPITALACGLAALSMAGVPPLFGFISKELLYEAKVQAPYAGTLIALAGIVANVLMVALAATVFVGPFFGRKSDAARKSHEAPMAMWLGPVVLGIGGLLLGLLSKDVASPIVSAAVDAIHAETTGPLKVKLWHGVNPVLMLGICTILIGSGLFVLRRRTQMLAARLGVVTRYGPRGLYNVSMQAMLAAAEWIAARLGHGYIRYYILTIVCVVLGGLVLTTPWQTLAKVDLAGQSVGWFECVPLVLIACGVVSVVLARRRLSAVISLGVVGLGVAVLFVVLAAPDLAMTQFAVETLTVVLFIFVLYRLPRFSNRSTMKVRIRDATIAIIAGVVVSTLVLAAMQTPQAGTAGSGRGTEMYASKGTRPRAAPIDSKAVTPHTTAEQYFKENSLSKAKGRNVVNVILVDFRALDTLGEITVTATAALGIWALMATRTKKQ